jgi:hypothetical protein
MRQVIENGAGFSTNNLFILLLHLDPEQIDADLAEFLSEMLKECSINRPQFEKFMSGLGDSELYGAFKGI